MKSERDFQSAEEYWDYIHTTCTLNVTCIILSKQWKSYSNVAIEAVKVADEVIKQLKKSK